MGNEKRFLVVGVVLLVVIGLVVGGYFTFRSPWKYRGDGPIKVFWVNSYDEGRSASRLEGFLDGLGEEFDVEVKVFELDTKNHPEEEWRVQKGNEAREMIDEWGPDLIYATDDNAQEYVVKYYVDAGVPVVFGGVNSEPEDYGYVGVRNVAGDLERYPIESAIESVHSILPYATKAIFVTDSGKTGEIAVAWLEGIKGDLDLEFVGVYMVETFDEYKELILDSQDVDVVFMRGLSTFPKSDVESYGLKEVVEWTVKNSDVPEVGLSATLANTGLLMVSSLTQYGQGFQAGEIAEKILINGERPSSILMESGDSGERYINLARAESLDLAIPSVILINSEVVEDFPWGSE